MAVGDFCRADVTYQTNRGPVRTRFCGPDNYVLTPVTTNTTQRFIDLSGFSGTIYVSDSVDDGATYTARTAALSSPYRMGIFASGNQTKIIVGYPANSPRNETTEIFRVVLSSNSTIPQSYGGTTGNNPVVTYEASVAMRGSGVMTGAGQVTRQAASAMRATGRLTATGTAITVKQGSAAIKGTGRMTATGTLTTARQASAALTGAGRVNATGTVYKPVQEASVALAGTGRMTAAGTLVRPLQATAALTATALVQAEGFVERELVVEMVGTAVLEAAGEILRGPKRAPDPVTHEVTTRRAFTAKVHPVTD